jgi:hypothetical protein
MRSQTSGQKEIQKGTQNLAANPSTHPQHNEPVPQVSISTQQPLQHQRHQHMPTPTLNKRKLRPRFLRNSHSVNPQQLSQRIVENK